MVGSTGPQEVMILLFWIVLLAAAVAGVWLTMNRLFGRRSD
jgi:hypothetical protein